MTKAPKYYKSAVNVVIENMKESLYKAAPYSKSCISTLDPVSSLSTGAVTDSVIQDIHASLLKHAYQEDEFYQQTTEIQVENIHPRNAGEITPQYENLLAEGYVDELRGLLVADKYCWGRFSLFRQIGEQPFSQKEIALANEVAKEFACKFRDEICRASLSESEFTAYGLFICSMDHKVLWKDEAGAEILQELRNDEQLIEETLLPSSVLAIIIQLKQQPTAAVSLLVRNSNNQGFYMMKGSIVKGVGESVAVSIIVQPAGMEELRPYKEQTYGFTPRESEVLELLLEGCTTNQIAQNLYISPHTVLDHCKSLLQKSDSANRKQMMRIFL